MNLGRVGTGSGLLISMLVKPQLVSFDCSINFFAIDLKMDGFALDGKLFFFFSYWMRALTLFLFI